MPTTSVGLSPLRRSSLTWREYPAINGPIGEQVVAQRRCVFFKASQWSYFPYFSIIYPNMATKMFFYVGSEFE